MVFIFEHAFHPRLNTCLSHIYLSSPPNHINVWGEPAFSVMVAGWFCEKSGWFGKVDDVKPVFLEEKKNRISTGNPFEEEDFYPGKL